MHSLNTTLKTYPQLWAFLVFTLSIGVSYRSIEPSTLSQIVQLGLLGITVFGFLKILNSSQKNSKETAPTLRILLLVGPILWFAVGSSLVGLLDGQALYALFTGVIPLAIFTMGAISVVHLIRQGVPLAAITTIVVIAAFCATLLRPLFFVFVQGGDLETGRWQILSNAQQIAISYCVARIFIRYTVRDVLLALSTVAIVLLSLTRTALLYPVAQMAAVIVLKPKLVLKPMFITMALVMAIILPLGWSTVSVIKPELTERWAMRMLGEREIHGVDITSLGRASEREYQLEMFTSSFPRMIFGHGLTAEILQGGSAAERLATILGAASVYDYAGRGFGHNIVTSLLYLGGLLFAAPFLIFMLAVGWWVIGIVKKIPSTEVSSAPHLLVIPFAAIAYLIFANLGILLGERCGAGFFGIIAALTYALYLDLNRPEKTPHVTPPTPSR